MNAVKMDHSVCNGWAVYGSDSVEGEDPENVHVAEVNVNDDGFTMNADQETICKRKLKPRKERKGIYVTKDAEEMREYLSDQQNKGVRVCGTCTSRFYGDNEK